MLLDVSKMRSNIDHIERRYAPDAFEPSADYVMAAPVDVAFDVLKDKDRYRLVGRAKTTLRLTCSRCVEEYDWPVDLEFDLSYLPQSENTGEGEVPLEEEDLSTAFYRDDLIDVGQMLREQVYLALPMKPLCRDECRGLCPVCGTNLNRDTCSCEPAWEDPRLAPLKGLLENNGPDRTD
jgi:uncharacterized protein